MIRMVHEAVDNGEGGIFCPRVFCDHCGELIDQAGQALTGWFPGKPERWSTPVELFTLHKRCNRAFEAARSPASGRMFWDSLDCLPLHLAANLPGSQAVGRKRSRLSFRDD